MNTKYGLTNNPPKRYFVFIVLLFLGVSGYSQQIKINAKSQTLSSLLLELRDKHNLNFSYNESELSQYTITARKRFASPDQAIDYLLTDLPLAYLKNEGVFVIYPDPSKLVTNAVAEMPLKKYHLSGKILDGMSLETLPFSFISVNNNTILSNENGRFNFVSESDSVFHLQISHLGYHLLDTIIAAGFNFQVALQPSIIEMKTVNVKAPLFIYALKANLQTGAIKINHQIAQYLPGNGDNSVFNVLRLQPGVLAAGEHKADMIVWASYPGQSRVSYDGFTVWGLKNFNDNIGVINPFMVKDIEVYKAAYQAQYGGSVGAIVNITGMDGNTNKPKSQLNFNNNTLNLYQSIPLFKKAALQIAHRQTYYNLYNSSVIEPKNTDNPNLIYAFPNYNYSDWNMKLAGNINPQNSYKLNYYTAKDKFDFGLEQQRDYINLAKKVIQTSNQQGLSFLYNKTWRKGNTSHLKLAASALNKFIDDTTSVTTIRNNVVLDGQNRVFINKVKEFRAEQSNNITLSENNKLKAGAEWNVIQSQLQIDSSNVNTYKRQINAHIVSVYAQNTISLPSQTQIKVGLRNDFLPSAAKHYPQIRLSVNRKLGKTFSTNLAWGNYYQYLSLVTTLDSRSNVQRVWYIFDGQKFSPTHSRHAVAQLNFDKNGWSANMELFSKNTTQLSRILHYNNQTLFSQGYNNTHGMGYMLKKQWADHNFWANYTFTNSLEHFNYFKEEETRQAFHSQQHEIKFAGMLALKPFYLSANYVWGSGFPNPTPNRNPGYVQQTYSRLDLSVVYRKRFTKIKLQAGFSVLNVFNTPNVRFDDIYTLNNSSVNYLQIYTQAVPFTPSVFLNIAL